MMKKNKQVLNAKNVAIVATPEERTQAFAIKMRHDCRKIIASRIDQINANSKTLTININRIKSHYVENVENETFAQAAVIEALAMAREIYKLACGLAAEARKADIYK